MFKVDNRSTKARCEISSKLTVMISEQCHCRCSGVFIVNLKYILRLVLVFLLLTLSRQMPPGRGPSTLGVYKVMKKKFERTTFTKRFTKLQFNSVVSQIIFS